MVFGHQSVGENILNGIKQLAARDGVNIDIHEQQDSALPSKASAIFPSATNGDPLSKIQDFAAAIDAGAAQGADMALMKLCYADFNADDQMPGRLANSLYRQPGILGSKASRYTLRGGYRALDGGAGRAKGMDQTAHRQTAQRLLPIMLRRAEFNTLLRRTIF